jgi:DNA polymerase III epsilon subunit family exonuclease
MQSSFMRDSKPALMRRSLVELRASDEPIGLVPLAQYLLAVSTPVAPDLARRVVAMALGRPAASLPERLQPHDLRLDGEFDVADIPIEEADWVVVDLETTGLAATGASILEVGAVRISGLQIVDRFETLVRPPGKIPQAIVALTGIHDEMVAEAPTTRSALRAFRNWLEITPTAPFVAHNASFDHGFVKLGLDACQLPAYPGPVVCTRKLGRRLVPELGRYSLDALSAHFGISNRSRHRALGDADATAIALIDMLRIALAGPEIRTVGELIDLNNRPPPKRKRKSKRPVRKRTASAPRGERKPNR